jgi:hypothetical protein
MRAVPLQMEMHLRNLGLLSRRALGKARDTEIVVDWGSAVKTVTQSVQTLLIPALATLIAPSSAPSRTLIPHGLNMPDIKAAGRMLAVVAIYDKHDMEKAQPQQQQQHLHHVGSEPHAQWLRSVDVAALTLQLLSQTDEVSSCSLLLPEQGGCL